MQRNKKILWFTLIEIIISITILSIIMISVMMIFTTSSALSYKTDINRSMQENVKNIIEDMAESVRENGVNICPNISGDCYDMSLATGKYISSDVLYSGDNTYYIARETTSGVWVKVDSADAAMCLEKDIFCTLVKNSQHPLSNKNVVLRGLNFYVSDDAIPKVTVTFAIEPSPKRWVRSAMIEKNTLYFQTTLSERIIKQK